MKRAFLVICTTVVLLSMTALVNCAGESKQATKPAAATTTIKRPMLPKIDRNFAFIAGAISKIDMTVPNNVKIEIINEADGKSHIVEVGPAANILKVIDVAELKTGERVRIMAKKTDNKETAMSIVTGKFKEMPRTKPAAPKPAAPKPAVLKK